jgi:hypothetical protein
MSPPYQDNLTDFWRIITHKKKHSEVALPADGAVEILKACTCEHTASFMRAVGPGCGVWGDTKMITILWIFVPMFDG